MIRHFGNHFGRFDAQDPIKLMAMTGALGGATTTHTKSVITRTIVLPGRKKPKQENVPVEKVFQTQYVIDKKGIESEREKTKIAELQTQAYAINYALTLKKIEKKMRKLKRDLTKSKKHGGMAAQIAEANAETILAMINRWNS